MSLKEETRDQIFLEIMLAIYYNIYDQKDIVDKYGISRQTVQRYVKKLIETGCIEPVGKTKPQKYKLIYHQYKKKYSNENLDEHLILRTDIAPEMEKLGKVAYDKIEYIFCEMLNNAIEHSECKNIEIVYSTSAISGRFFIHDDGVGIFTKIQEALGLPEKRFAILELSKGKYTTDPDRHTGEGIFFSSRIASVFAIISDGLTFRAALNSIGKDTIWDNNYSQGQGTTVFFDILINDNKTIEEVFHDFTEHPDHIGFNKTCVPVKLLNYGDPNAGFVSRSQARRLLGGFDRFNDIILDFEGVEAIRQGFADEIFRVFKNEHPQCNLTYCNANDQVINMIKHVQNTK